MSSKPTQETDRELSPEEQAIVNRCIELARQCTDTDQLVIRVERCTIRVRGEAKEVSSASVAYPNRDGVWTDRWKRTEGSTEVSGSWWVGTDSHEGALRLLQGQLEGFLRSASQ